MPPSFPSLQRSVALDLRGVTRDRALTEIGRAAGLSVVYASEVIPGAGSVVLTNRAISVGEAFRTILAGLPIDVLIGEHGSMILLARAAIAVAVVDGVVVDSVSRTPVRLAAVRLDGRSEMVLTDDAGRFHLTGSPGALQVDVRRIGFRPASLRVTAVLGITKASIALAPTPVGLPTVAVGADRGDRTPAPPTKPAVESSPPRSNERRTAGLVCMTTAMMRTFSCLTADRSHIQTPRHRF